MTNENETTPATVPAETVQAETTPDASVDAPAPGKAPKAPRKRGKGKAEPKGKDDAKGKAKGRAEAPAARVNHVAEVQARVGRKRIVWQGKPLDWPKAARESGKRAEAILKAAGTKGLTYAEY